MRHSEARLRRNLLLVAAGAVLFFATLWFSPTSCSRSSTRPLARAPMADAQLTGVPEPRVYGLAGGIVLIALIAWRRRKQR